MKFELRDCIRGEYKQNNACIPCLSGTYSLDTDKECDDCPEGAVCKGRDEMYPKAGYWRSGDDTDIFYLCPN